MGDKQLSFDSQIQPAELFYQLLGLVTDLEIWSLQSGSVNCHFPSARFLGSWGAREAVQAR